MTSSQAGEACKACQARGEWLGVFFNDNLLFGDVSGVGMWLGTSCCLPHFRPVPAPAEGGGGEGQGQESCISVSLAWVTLSQAGLEQHRSQARRSQALQAGVLQDVGEGAVCM